jgi:sporulation integral membrane protein YlbJ
MFPFQKLTIIILGVTCTFMCILVLLFPNEGLHAAIRGVSIWWDVLFPALFPFFVISEILLGFGIVHFFGTLLDPMMRPLFRVPGIGGFVMAMGFASGYPVGARLTSQLWEQKLVNREEGERLVAFTSTSDPIFLIGAVAVGFFHDVGLAGILAVSHYGSGIVVGLIMKYYGHTLPPTATRPSQSSKSILIRAIQAMHKARLMDGRPLGLLIKEAIETSLRLVFIIGGLVVFFSVILELLTLSHVMNFFYIVVETALMLVGLPAALSHAIVNGFFEVTLGAKNAGQSELNVLLVHKVAVASFVLSWGGLSVHAQIASLLSHTNLRYYPFLIARLLQGFIAAVLVYLLWEIMLPVKSNLLPAWSEEGNQVLGVAGLFKSFMFIFVGVFFMIILLFIIYKFCKLLQKRFL